MRPSHRLIQNAAAISVGQAASLVVGLVLPPFVVSRIGPGSYGAVVVLASVLQFIALVQLGTPSALNRFVSGELARDRHEELSRVLSSGLALLLAAASIAALLLLAVLAFPDKFLDVPPGVSVSTMRLVALVMGVTTVASLPLSLGDLAFYSTERFSQLAVIQIGAILLRLGLIVWLLTLFPSSILAYVVGNSLSTLAASATVCVLGMRLIPQVQFALRHVTLATLRRITGYGFEVFFNIFAILLYLQADYFIVGKSLDTSAVTTLSLAAVWGTVLRGLVGSAVSVVLPSAAIRQARGESEGLRALLVRSTKYALLLGSVPVLFLCVFRDDVILAWMGQGYETTAALMVPLLCADLLTAATASGNDLFTGLGRIRVYTVVTLLFGAVNVLAVVLLTAVLGFGLGAVAWTYLAVFVLRSGIILPAWSARQLGLGAADFYRQSYVGPVLAGGAGLVVLLLLRLWISPGGWPPLIATAALFAPIFAALAYFLALDAYDRQILRSMGGQLALQLGVGRGGSR